MPPPPAPPPPPLQQARPAPRPTPPQPRRPQVAEQAPVQPYSPPVAAAPVAPAPAPAAAPARAASLSPSFLGQISAALRRVQRYPTGARARHSEGVAHVTFILTRDGTVVGPRLSRSSGDEELDTEAVSMLQRANLPSLPSDYGDSQSMTVPIRFSLNR
jgi:TonB family protein